MTSDEPDGKALFMQRYVTADAVDGSMMIELFTDGEPQTPQQSVERAILGVKTRNGFYRELGRGTRKTSAGLQLWFVKFEVLRKGSPYLEQYAVLPISGNTRVNIFSSLWKSSSEQNLSAVENFIQSVRLAS